MTKEEALKLYAASVRDWRTMKLHIPGNENTLWYYENVVKWYKKYPDAKSITLKAFGR